MRSGLFFWKRRLHREQAVTPADPGTPGVKTRKLYGNLISHMQHRLNQRPGDLRLRYSLVSHLRQAGRFDEAIRQARDLLRLDPRDRRAKSILLQLRLEQRLAALRDGFK